MLEGNKVARQKDMKLKRIKKLRVNSTVFDVVWDKKDGGAGFDYTDPPTLTIGTSRGGEARILMLLCHELWEICAIEMSVRLSRPDCATDFIFVYDHRQHDTMSEMFAGLLTQFIN